MIGLLVSLLIVAMIAGLIYAAFRIIPLPPLVRTILTCLLILIVVIWLVSLLFGPSPLFGR